MISYNVFYGGWDHPTAFDCVIHQPTAFDCVIHHLVLVMGQLLGLLQLAKVTLYKALHRIKYQVFIVYDISKLQYGGNNEALSVSDKNACHPTLVLNY